MKSPALRLFGLASSFSLCLFSFQPAIAQEGAPPKQEGASPKESSTTFRVRAETVLVDLIVQDKQGNFVTDLKPEEVEIREDGKKQQMTGLEYYAAAPEMAAGDGRGESLDGAAFPSGRISQGNMAAPRFDQLIVFAIDLGSVRHGELVMVRRSIEDFLSAQEAGNASFMLATLGPQLQVRRTFTRQPEEVMAALDRVSAYGDPDRLRLLHFLDDVERVFSSIAGGRATFDHLLAAARAATTRGAALLADVEAQVYRTSISLAVLSSYLRPLPGRKHVVLFSGGYHLNLADTIQEMVRLRVSSLVPTQLSNEQRAQLSVAQSGIQRRSLSGHLHKALDEANRSQVSIYSVDTRGLVPTSGDPAMTSKTGAHIAVLGHNVNYASIDAAAPQDFLVSLASGSGGLTFINSNDLQRGVRQAYRDSQEFYLLSYQPSAERRKGKYHRIDVRIKRRDISIRHRDGYLDIPEEEVEKQQVYNALAFPGLFQNFGVQLQVEPEEGGLQVQTMIPTHALNFQHLGAEFFCPVETYGALVDSKGAWVGKQIIQFAKQHDLRYDSTALNELRQVDFVTSKSGLSAPPGTYTLVVIVRQGSSALIGSATRRVEVKASALDED